MFDRHHWIYFQYLAEYSEQEGDGQGAHEQVQTAQAGVQGALGMRVSLSGLGDS